MRNFDFYEFTGILVPGALTLAILGLLLPGIPPTLQAVGSISVGGLGIFVLLAYAAGHLIQGVGNIVESIFWKLQGGMPTEWIRSEPQKLLSGGQVGELSSRIRPLSRIASDESSAELSSKEWIGITRQAYAMVQKAGRAGRIDVFNGNYGLMRGISAGLFVCLAVLPFSPIRSLGMAGFLTACTVVALARMRRFGIHYGRELFTEFLLLDSTQKGMGTGA
jgi:hypothetical protein